MRKFIIAGTIAVTLFSSTVFAGERLNLGYIYSASKSHSEIIEFTNNSVNVVSPTCFDMTPNGRLDINGMIDKEFIDEMHAKGIKVTPFLSNHWGKKRAQAALRNPYPIIQEVVTAVYEYNLDGVNVDLENLDAKDKAALTNFMRLMREAMPADKTVSIAVAANPEKLTSTWIAAYDYKELAQYVDYMVVMTYDEHCYGGSEGPVAGINFVEKSIKAVLDEGVSKDKIVMGIPLYGRFWQVGKDVGGEAIVIANVPRLIKKHKLVPKYNEFDQTPFVKLQIHEGGTSSYINGRVLEPGTYNIYYENENSIRAKLDVVNKYNILGTALWALDNEDADFWTYYKDALNETEYETDAEVKYRKKLEYAARYIVETEIPELAIKNSTKYVQKIDLKLNYKMDKALNENPKIFIALMDEIFILPEQKKTKTIKIRRFYIDENNELKVRETSLYYNTSYVEAVSMKSLVTL